MYEEFTKEHREKMDPFIDKKLRRRLTIFIIVLIIMLGILVYNLVIGHITLLLAFNGLIIGTLVGLIAGRMFKIYWHPEHKVVMARMDTLGIFSLVTYIAFAVSRKWIFAHFVNAQMLTAFLLATVAGVMLGRVYTTGIHIRKVLLNNVTM